MLDGAATCTPPMLASMKRRHFLSAGAASMVGVGAWADAQPPIRLLAGFQAGGYHTNMLFNLKVVSRAEFDQHMADLKAAGLTGILGDEFCREKLMKGEDLETSGGLK